MIFFTKSNIRKLNLLSKTGISKIAWINPCWLHRILVTSLQLTLRKNNHTRIEPRSPVANSTKYCYTGTNRKLS